MKDAVGHGILVAYNAFGPFVYKAVGVGGMLHQQVVVGLFQQFGARCVIVLFRKASKWEAMLFRGCLQCPRANP